MRRRRIWSEFLPPGELGHPATRALLKRFGLQPIVALPGGAQDEAMARALRACYDDGIVLGIWPLLGDDEGYWPSADNALAFARGAKAALAFTRGAGVHVTTLAIDLEPTLALKRGLTRGSLWSRGACLWRADWDARHASRERRWDEAVYIYSQLADELRVESIESFSIVVPPVAFELASGGQRWQKLLSVPVLAPSFATLSPMIYSSVVRQAIPGKSAVLARALVADVSRRAARSRRPVCISIGIVGPAATGGAGKLGDERCYESVAELQMDLALVRRAGIDDVALFSLEGLLGRDNPEAWLRAFTGSS